MEKLNNDKALKIFEKIFKRITYANFENKSYNYVTKDENFYQDAYMVLICKARECHLSGYGIQIVAKNKKEMIEKMLEVKEIREKLDSVLNEIFLESVLNEKDK